VGRGARHINPITALPRATAPGLQVQTPDGSLDAVAPPGLAIINTGLMMKHITNGSSRRASTGW
jgi:isopenicillin N synthase-like dioxygenase